MSSSFLPRIPARSLDTIRVFFPDPWPKQRQRTRRLIRADVVRRLSTLMRAGGTLHLATDAADYALRCNGCVRRMLHSPAG